MKRFRLPFVVEISLVVVFSLLVVISCFSTLFETKLYIRNACKNPFHIEDEDDTIAVRIPVNRVALIKTFNEEESGFDPVILHIARNDVDWARLTITPQKYPEDVNTTYSVYVTITEDTSYAPYTFHASVKGDALAVELENLIP